MIKVEGDSYAEMAIESMLNYQARQAALEPLRTAYCDFFFEGCGGVAEQSSVYLQGSGFNFDSRRRILTIAYQLSNLKPEEYEEEFRQLTTYIQEAINDEIRHDGPDVMNMVGVADEIEKNKDLIFQLAPIIIRKIPEARERLVLNGFDEFQSTDPMTTFMVLVPPNPEALGYSRKLAEVQHDDSSGGTPTVN